MPLYLFMEVLYYRFFLGEERKEPDYFISGLKKHRMFRSGDYKIVRLNGEKWELYNIINDPTELENLADSLPHKVIELSNYYASTQIRDSVASVKNKY